MYRLWHYLEEQFLGEQNRWFLWMPVLFAIGIGAYFVLPQEISPWWTLGIIESLIVLAVLFRRRIFALVLLMIVAVVVLGFTNIQLKALYLSENPQVMAPEKTYLSGKISAIDYNYRGNQRLLLTDTTNFEKDRNFGSLKVSVRSKETGLHVGQCVEMAVSIMPLAKAAMVGGYQFDRKAYFDGLSGNGYALSQALPIECEIPTSWSQNFKFGIDKLRNKIIAHIREVLPPDQASITAAIIAGEQGVIRKEVIQNYRDSGLAHFLSISGLHMSMIAGLMFFLVRLIVAFIPALAVRYDSKKLAAVFAILISIFYLLISGAQIPAQRAFIMNFIVVLGILLGRRAISMKTISWAGLFVLILTPQALVGASFQMSFAAVVALIAFYEKYAGNLQRFLNGNKNAEQSFVIKFIKIIWVYIIGIMVSDLVASLATMPFAIYHFNKIAVYTTLTNLLAGPIIGLIIMPFVLLSLLLMPLGLDYWPLKITGWGVEQINHITAYVSSLQGAGYQVVSMPLWGLLTIVFGALWLCIWNKSWRKLGWIGVVIGTLSVFSVKTPDVLINEDASAVAFKDNMGELVIMPSRGNYFSKKIWLEKTANNKLSAKQNKLLKQIYKGEAVDANWLDLKCDNYSCIYKNVVKYYKDKRFDIAGKAIDIPQTLGVSVYLDGAKQEIITVRDYIGNRYWNK